MGKVVEKSRLVAVGEAVKEPIVKLATERKHLTDMVKMVGYQIESDLLSMISPHFARSDGEGRTLVQNLLASAADLEVTKEELRVKVPPFAPSSPPLVLKGTHAAAAGSTMGSAPFQEDSCRFHSPSVPPSSYSRCRKSRWLS